MFFQLLMAAAAKRTALSFSGMLSRTSNISPVETAAPRTINASGTLLFNGISTEGGTPQYSKNGGAYTNITEGLTLAMTGGDTLSVRCSLGDDQSCQFNVRNNSGSALIEAVTLENPP